MRCRRLPLRCRILSPDLTRFYHVEAPDDQLDALAEALLDQAVVDGAYIKPRLQPPVVRQLPPSPQEAPPATPNFFARQTYLDAAPGGIGAVEARTRPGGRGRGVRIIDIEGAWRFSHEDMLQNQGGVIGGLQSTDISLAQSWNGGRRRDRGGRQQHWRHRHLSGGKPPGHLGLRLRTEFRKGDHRRGQCPESRGYHPDRVAHRRSALQLRRARRSNRVHRGRVLARRLRGHSVCDRGTRRDRRPGGRQRSREPRRRAIQHAPHRISDDLDEPVQPEQSAIGRDHGGRRRAPAGNA